MAFGITPSSQSQSSSSQQSQIPPPKDKQKKLQVRLTLKEAAHKAVNAINAESGQPFAYDNKSKNDEKLKACKAGEKSHVTAILRTIEKRESNYQAALDSCTKAMKMATKYIQDHQKPEYDDRVKLCEDIVKEIKTKLASIEKQNALACAMAEQYIKTAMKGYEVPFEAARAMKVLLGHKLLSDDTKAKLQAAIDAYDEKADRSAGFAAVKTLRSDDGRDKAEVLNRHGCFKASDGGSSDVRLLENEDGSIAYAYKSVAGESGGGLTFLFPNCPIDKLPKGASSMREDVSSTICQSIKTATKLDLGFPMCRVVKLDGEPGALIDGVKGEMADPEQLDWMLPYEEKHGEKAANEKRAKIKQKCRDIPDSVTADSLQNVVLSSVLTCQWDCKWGNVIVEDGGEDGGKARPIDGGTAIPTKDVVRRLRDGPGGCPTPSALTMYPPLTSEPDKPMAQAQEKISSDKVTAILKLNAKDLMAQAKARRDKLVQENPEFDITLMDDSCFDIVQASIEGAQAILKNNPDITLADFAKAYEQWFIAYAKNV
jgi:hypothetical protein